MSDIKTGTGNHTSVRLRQMAIKAIEEIGRPITAHEMETWLATNEPGLWHEVQQKCYDYVRMILSVTKNNIIVRYKCIHGIEGVDRRAIFYGLSSKYYDDKDWIRDPEGKKRRSNKKTKKEIIYEIEQEELPPSSPEVLEEEPVAPAVEQCTDYNLPAIEYVNEQVASASWKKLSNEVLMSDPLWVELLQALNDVKLYIDQGYEAQHVLRYLFDSYESFHDPMIAADAYSILCREAIVNSKAKIEFQLM